MPVEVVPYSPSWPVQFELVAADLRQALSALPSARVEHVGSTSVPGLAAKPTLDIDVIVDGEEMRKAVAAMGSLRAQYPLGVVVNRPSVWPDR